MGSWGLGYRVAAGTTGPVPAAKGKGMRERGMARSLSGPSLAGPEEEGLGGLEEFRAGRCALRGSMLGDLLEIPAFRPARGEVEALTQRAAGQFCLLPHRMFSGAPRVLLGKRPDKQQRSPKVQPCRLFLLPFMPVVTNICFEA